MTTRNFHHFINGAFVASSSGATFDKRRPSDNEVIGRVAEGGAAEIAAAVTAARSALHGPWSKLRVEQRVAMLCAVADGINRRAEEFVTAEMNDTGQPHGMLAHAFIPRGAPL